jgi:hypothetical protein
LSKLVSPQDALRQKLESRSRKPCSPAGKLKNELRVSRTSIDTSIDNPWPPAGELKRKMIHCRGDNHCIFSNQVVVFITQIYYLMNKQACLTAVKVQKHNQAELIWDITGKTDSGDMVLW